MTKALIVVDLQQDFCEGGALAVAGGNAVADRITNFITRNGDDYYVVVASKDWHPDNLAGEHFQQFPKHCIANTLGAEFTLSFDETLVDELFYKGQGQAGFSAYQGRNSDDEDLHTYLRERMDVYDVDVVGLATDYCVAATAKQAVDLGYRTTVIADLCAAVVPGNEQEVLEMLDTHGVIIKHISDYVVEEPIVEQADPYGSVDPVGETVKAVEEQESEVADG